MAKLTPFPTGQELDANGDPLSGGKVYTYEAGTTTPKTSYTDASEDTANANPVILDSAGRGEIWLGEGSYYIRVFDADDNLIDERDDVIGDSSSSFLGSTFEISANTTITVAYQNSFISCTSSPTLSLLAAAGAGEGFSFAVKNDGSGTVTIDPNGAETIDGSATITLAPNDFAIVVSNGTKWFTTDTTDFAKQSSDNTFTGTVKFQGAIQFPDDGELTISTGAVTVTGAFHTIDTESDAASDDLDTINGGEDGELLVVFPENGSRDIVIKHNTGNIQTADGSDVTLSGTNQCFVMIYSSALTKWVEVSRPATALLDEDDFSSDSATQAPTQQSTKAYVDGKVVIKTTVDTSTNQTYYDVSIAAGAKIVDLSFIGISTNGTSRPIVQLGDSGGIETSGYNAGYTYATGSPSAGTTSDGFHYGGALAANAMHGNMRLVRVGSSTWSCSGASGYTTIAGGTLTYGSKTLSGELTTIRITAQNGTDIHDAGSLGATVHF